MKRPLRVAVADDEPDVREYFQKILTVIGHEVVAVAQTGRELIEQCRATQPDLVITDIKMPDMDGLDAAIQIGRERPTPVIIVSGYHDDELIRRAEGGPILAYLIKPIKQGNLEAAIGIAIERFKEFQTVAAETATLRQALEDRKVIERAKGILMKRSGMHEQQAFRRLQQMASDKNHKLVEIARMILTAEEVFALPKSSDRAQ